MPPLSAIGALNAFDLRKIQAFQPEMSSASYKTNPFIQSAAAPQYNLSHPRANDSEGLVNVSPLAKKLDILS